MYKKQYIRELPSAHQKRLIGFELFAIAPNIKYNGVDNDKQNCKHGSKH